MRLGTRVSKKPSDSPRSLSEKQGEKPAGLDLRTQVSPLDRSSELADLSKWDPTQTQDRCLLPRPPSHPPQPHPSSTLSFRFQQQHLTSPHQRKQINLQPRQERSCRLELDWETEQTHDSLLWKDVSPTGAAPPCKGSSYALS